MMVVAVLISNIRLPRASPLEYPTNTLSLFVCLSVCLSLLVYLSLLCFFCLSLCLRVFCLSVSLPSLYACTTTQPPNKRTSAADRQDGVPAQRRRRLPPHRPPGPPVRLRSYRSGGKGGGHSAGTSEGSQAAAGQDRPLPAGGWSGRVHPQAGEFMGTVVWAAGCGSSAIMAMVGHPTMTALYGASALIRCIEQLDYSVYNASLFDPPYI